MGGGGNSFSTLLKILESAVSGFPDKRSGKNKRYSMRDVALSGFSVFFLQCPSFLSHQVLMQQVEGSNNARTLFGIERILTDPQIRNLLDPVPPEKCFPVFREVQDYLEQKHLLEQQYHSSLDSYLLALDGTWFHNSEAIYCPECLQEDHSDGRRTYYHSAITPVLVKPGNNRVIALEPEFIRGKDGQGKQDCERKAAKRWVGGVGMRYVSKGITLLGDDMYSAQPFCKDILTRGYHFIFTCKSSSHKYLSQWIEAADVGVDIGELIHKRWTGKERLYYRYRFMNDVPLKDGKDALRVNWCELVILDKEGKMRMRRGFVTDYLISRHNVVDLIECGRSRWKIENEHNNTLKTKGYNLEHNFGHGKEHLSNLLLTFNLIAFLFHTVLEYFDKRYALLRKSLGRRQTFFEDIRSLTRYSCFDSWDDLLLFMLRGLKLPDPGG